MTSIAVWVGVDSRGPSSINIASDSRISWDKTKKWDQGKKIFATREDAHLFAYCGDVLFPALVLPVIVDLIDRGLLGNDHSEIEQILKSEMADYPDSRDFTIFHVFRMGEGMSCEFRLSLIEYRSGHWLSNFLPIPQSSAFMYAGGSGKQSIKNADFNWGKSNSAGTSRAVFGAFCEAINSGKDLRSGGPPQLGTLYRTGAARLIGIVINNKCYFAGRNLDKIDHTANIEWRNELFERYDGSTKKRIDGAQRHLPRL